jgi:hypothetical protein
MQYYFHTIAAAGHHIDISATDFSACAEWINQNCQAKPTAEVYPTRQPRWVDPEFDLDDYEYAKDHPAWMDCDRLMQFKADPRIVLVLPTGFFGRDDQAYWLVRHDLSDPYFFVDADVRIKYDKLPHYSTFAEASRHVD